MPNDKYDFESAALSVACKETPTDSLHLHFDPVDGLEDERRVWFAMNTAYPSTRITVLLSTATQERLYETLKTALGK
jgi:hypothetical protein